MLVFVIFILAGAGLANVFPVLKFAVFASIVSSLYLVYLLFTTSSFPFALLYAAGGFVCIQVGYVFGLALRTLYGHPIPNRPIWYSSIRKEEDSKLK